MSGSRTEYSCMGAVPIRVRCRSWGFGRGASVVGLRSWSFGHGLRSWGFGRGASVVELRSWGLGRGFGRAAWSRCFGRAARVVRFGPCSFRRAAFDCAGLVVLVGRARFCRAVRRAHALPVRGGSPGEDLGPPGAAGRALSPAREERARAVTARDVLEPGVGARSARAGEARCASDERRARARPDAEGPTGFTHPSALVVHRHRRAILSALALEPVVAPRCKRRANARPADEHHRPIARVARRHRRAISNTRAARSSPSRSRATTVCHGDLPPHRHHRH